MCLVSVTRRRMDNAVDAMRLFMAATAIAAVAGFASLLKNHSRKLTLRTVSGTLLYNGMSGLVMALFWYNNFGAQDQYYLLSLAGIVGFTGPNMTEFGVRVLQRAIIEIRGGNGEKPYKSYRGDSDVVG